MPNDLPYPDLASAAAGWTYQPPTDLLKGRTILVTGAGDGIGRCAARTFASYGADVVLVGRTAAKLEATSDWITAHTRTKPTIVPCDLEICDRDAYDDLCGQILDHYGCLDGLLHNAGLLGPRTPIAHQDGGQWRRLMDVHVNAVFEMTAALLPALEASTDARVLFTSSTVGRQGRAFWGAYAVSKFAVEGLAQVLADEVENQGIRVATVNPGATRTQMRAAAYPGEDPATVATPEQRMGVYLYFMGPAGASLPSPVQLDARTFEPPSERQPAGEPGTSRSEEGSRG